MEHQTNKIEIRRGIRKGDRISPKLFTAALENMFKQISWEIQGINISKNREELQYMLNNRSRQIGLQIDMKMTYESLTPNRQT